MEEKMPFERERRRKIKKYIYRKGVFLGQDEEREEKQRKIECKKREKEGQERQRNSVSKKRGETRKQ
jgi:hypothetical protein